jgi:hypothetical protein
LVGAGFFLALLLIGVQAARAAEIIPSLGVTRAVNTDDEEARLSGGLAFRAPIFPALKAEIGGSYRSDSQFGGDLNIREWPLTGSLWLSPIPAVYVGGGVGWYHTTFDYDDATLLEDETTQDFGVHLGAGLEVPLSPSVGVDLNGRYVFRDDVSQKLSTDTFDPDFWSTTVGLAFKF